MATKIEVSGAEKTAVKAAKVSAIVNAAAAKLLKVGMATAARALLAAPRKVAEFSAAERAVNSAAAALMKAGNAELALKVLESISAK